VADAAFGLGGCAHGALGVDREGAKPVVVADGAEVWQIVLLQVDAGVVEQQVQRFIPQCPGDAAHVVGAGDVEPVDADVGVSLCQSLQVLGRQLLSRTGAGHQHAPGTGAGRSAGEGSNQRTGNHHGADTRQYEESGSTAEQPEDAAPEGAESAPAAHALSGAGVGDTEQPTHQAQVRDQAAHEGQCSYTNLSGWTPRVKSAEFTASTKPSGPQT